VQRFGLIARTYPGLFRIDQLMGLDARDLALWVREAGVEQYRREIDMLTIIRRAVNGTPDAFDDRIRELQAAISKAEGREAESHASAWESLKAIGQG
jgi:hypothetical protein